MEQSTGGIRVPQRHESSLGRTPTRRHSVGQQGTPSPRTSGRPVMPRRQTQSYTISQQQGGKAEWALEREKNKVRSLELGDGEEDGRGERPLAAKA